MNYYQEKIETDSIIPAKIYINKSNSDNCHYALHWHSHIEFDYILEGKLKGKINRKVIDVPTGDFFFVNSGELHETDAYDWNHIKSITILLSYHLLKEYYPDIDQYYFDFTDHEDAKNKISSLIQRCADVFEKKEELYELELSILLKEVCYILLKKCKVKKEVIRYNNYEQKSIQNIKKAITYLEEHYESDITLSLIAYEIGMTPTYFSRFFKKTTGETFYYYLNKIRLLNAYNELMNSDNSMTEIAYNNGFANVKSFIEIFKKEYNLTPFQYKKKIINDNNK